ncbi:DUF6090 family protein [Geojedonia litorea]|uniref:DUF6090 family protein n=1 Tax=Geojedonia litorea TaxID=1268269 RepID=A0ABV9MYB5_9FLAO
MIKFFRQIRRDLMEKNKTGKYFKYAVGEIILVVIGILIALQINNWNEQRKSTKKELILLTELQSSLNLNRKKLNKRSFNFKNLNYEGKLLEEHLNSNLAYNDTLKNYFTIPTADYSFQISYSTYENLKSQGFDIINNSELRLKIIRLHDEVFSSLNDQEIKTSNLLTNSISPIIFKYFKTSAEGYEPNDYQNLLNSEEYLNVLSLMTFLAEVYEMDCNKSIIEIDELLTDIDKEIEKYK